MPDPIHDLARRVAQIRARVADAARAAGRDPAEITLLAATKTQDAQTVRAAIAAGITACGENRVQEMTEKLGQYAYDGARLHFIGHLQTNKVRQVVGRVELIESVDSERLLEAIDREAGRLGIVQDILLEVNIAGEASKGGFHPDLTHGMAARAAALPHVRLRGLMCIPPVSDKSGENRPFFAAARQLYIDMIDRMGDNRSVIDRLSMGMSGDFEDAVCEGATLIRLGTALFGTRAPVPPQQAPLSEEICL